MIVAALALAGIFISLYLTLYKLGVIAELSCSVGSCETVNLSKWSRFLGLPVAAWGLLFYLDVFTIALVGTIARFEYARVISLVLVLEAAVGVLFSAWLTYLELAVIHAICIWCVTSAVVVTLILIVSVADWREAGGGKRGSGEAGKRGSGEASRLLLRNHRQRQLRPTRSSRAFPPSRFPAFPPPALPHSNQLVRLDTQSPLRVLQAVVDRKLRITRNVGSVHRLQEEMFEFELCELFRPSVFLRVNQFELTARGLHEWRAGLGTNADPIEGRRCGARSVGLDSDVEAAFVQSGNQWFVELQQRLTACADHVLPIFATFTEVAKLAAPAPIDCLRKRLRARELAALWSCANEIGVAELAYSAGSILFAPRPKIAS
jgi:uncharacterized membrane protein